MNGQVQDLAGGLLGDEDLAYAALSLEHNTSASLLVWEDTWAAPVASAVRDANGVILEGARIPHEFVEAAVKRRRDQPEELTPYAHSVRSALGGRS